MVATELEMNDQPAVDSPERLSTEYDQNTILVRQIDWKMNDIQQIRSFFEKFGSIQNVQKGRSGKPIAFLTFKDKTSVSKVMQASVDQLVYKNQQFCVAKSRRKRISKRSRSLQTECNGDECISLEERNLTPIHNLPNELLDYIFTFLDIRQRIRTELVCKRWRWIGKCQLWTEPKCLVFVPDEPNKIPMNDSWELTDEVLTTILSRCGPSLRVLALSRQRNYYRYYKLPDYKVSLTLDSLKIIGKYCPNLREIKLKEIPITETGLKKLAQGCRKLKIVTLLNCELLFEYVSLGGFFKRCKSVESLTLGHCYKGDCFDFSKNLKVFRVEGLKYLSPVTLQQLMVMCNNLQELSLRCASKGVTPELLVSVLRHFSKTLKVLDLSGHFAGVIDWREALVMLNSLEELHMYDRSREPLLNRTSPCPDVSCKNLQILHVYSASAIFDEMLVRNLLANASHLQELHLTSCFHISPEWIKVHLKHPEIIKIIEFCEFAACTAKDWCDILGKMPNLESLCLSLCKELNDELMTILLKHCTKLKLLKIPLSTITDEGLITLATISSLRVLDITFNKGGVTCKGIVALATQGTIEELHLSEATDECCSAFARLCPNFRILNVTDVKEITNNLVAAFSTALENGYLKQRVALFVGNTSVTEDVIRHYYLDVIFGSMRALTFSLVTLQ